MVDRENIDHDHVGLQTAKQLAHSQLTDGQQVVSRAVFTNYQKFYACNTTFLKILQSEVT